MLYNKKKNIMKKIFITLPLIIFFILVAFAYCINNLFLQNLSFCISSALLGIVATFLVIDNYYKKNEEIENKKILLNLAQNFFMLTNNTYFALISSYTLNINKINSEMFLNNEILVKEIEELVEQIKEFKINDYSKYRNDERSNSQLKLLHSNLNEIKETFLYLPKTLDIYKNCFPILLNVVTYFQYFELRIKNDDTMLDFDASTFFLSFIIDFNKVFVEEVKKLKYEALNIVLFQKHFD